MDDTPQDSTSDRPSHGISSLLPSEVATVCSRAALNALEFARQEALSAGASEILTEHLLLGVIRDESNRAVALLAQLGVNPKTVRTIVGRQLSGGTAMPGGSTPLSDRARRVVELAAQERRYRGDEQLTPEHLLIGLIGEAEGLGGKVLGRLGVTPARTRCLSAHPPARDLVAEKTGAPGWTERAQRVIEVALGVATNDRCHAVDTEHLLVALLDEDDHVAARVLFILGKDQATLSNFVRSRLRRGDHTLTSTIPLSPGAKRAIELALAEARRLNNDYIGTEHLLCALILDDGAIGGVFEHFGVRLESVRRVIIALQDGHTGAERPRQGGAIVMTGDPAGLWKAAGQAADAPIRVRVAPSETDAVPGDLGVTRSQNRRTGSEREHPMWQRFTERSRRVVFLAQEEAGKLGDRYVSTEHLLLALLRASDTVAARILTSQGLNLTDILVAVEREVVRGDGQSGQDMLLTPRAKIVVDLAYDEARMLDSTYIGTEHLLLGLVREREGVAGRVLSEFGVNLERVRAEVKALQGDRHGSADADSTPQATLDISTALARFTGELRARLEGLVTAPEPTRPTSRPDRETCAIGDICIARGFEGRVTIDMARDASAFIRLDSIYQAKDTYGYREITGDGKVLVTLSELTVLKLLLPPEGTQWEDICRRGYYVRVLDGDHEGLAGWVFRDCVQRVGADRSVFPPLPDLPGTSRADLPIDPTA